MSRREVTVVYDGQVELSERGARALADYEAVKAEIVKLEEMAGLARSVVEAELDEAEAGTVNGQVVVTWARSEALILDQTRLKQDMGDLLKPYMRPSPRRTFKVVD